jgi:uncharacterized membrane protein
MSRATMSQSSYKTFLRPATPAIIWGLVVLVFLGLADQLSMHYGLKESQRVVDDICGAIIAGVLVYWYERRRTRYISEKLKTIELMNHHVRNALQVISYSTYVQAHSQQISDIRDAINKIDWALREILPAEGARESKPAPQEPVNEHSGDQSATG